MIKLDFHLLLEAINLAIMMEPQAMRDPNNNPVNQWLANAHAQQNRRVLSSEVDDDLEFLDAKEDFYGQ